VAPATRTSLELRLRNLALADFTPYAVKFAGYRIEAGQLSARLRYRVREGRLVGSNGLEFDRLKLGEKVESACAADLPMALGEALASRPQLRVSVRAGYEPQADTQALKRAAVLREVAKRAGYGAAAGSGAPAALDLRDAKIRRAAEGLYLARVGTAFDLGSLKPREQGYGQRLIAALAEKTELPAGAAGALAPRRAQAVRDALVKGGIDAARIGVMDTAPVEAGDDGVPTGLGPDTP